MRQMLQQQRARAGEGREAGPGRYRLGIVPPRTSDGRKLTTDQVPVPGGLTPVFPSQPNLSRIRTRPTSTPCAGASAC
jgi:hypothetical protein